MEIRADCFPHAEDVARLPTGIPVYPAMNFEADESGLLAGDGVVGTADAHAEQEAPPERQTILTAIEMSAGNMSHAAQRLGVSRNTLYRRCKQLGIPLLRGKRVSLSG